MIRNICFYQHITRYADRTDGQMDRLTDRRIDEWTDGWMINISPGATNENITSCQNLLSKSNP